MWRGMAPQVLFGFLFNVHAETKDLAFLLINVNFVKREDHRKLFGKLRQPVVINPVHIEY